MTSVYLIAGEASGDNLGAGLMRAMRAQAEGRDLQFTGVGGDKMIAEGMKSLFDYSELSLMGFSEILPHLATLAARMRSVVEDIHQKQPDVVLTIDSPGFAFRAVERLRAMPDMGKTRFVHYVAPSVWAYKPERAAKCARLFHHLLALLPFEPPYFEREGLATTFVGHPVAFMPKGDGHAFRVKHNIAADAPMVCLLPGSRKNEIKRHMPEFARAVNLLGAAHPNVAMAVAVPPRLIPMVAMYFEGCPYRTILMSDEAEKRGAMAAATCAIVKSGTVALEVAAQGCAHIVTYKANALTMAIARRLVKIPHVSLVNIMLKREVVPELIQERCKAEHLVNALEPLIRHEHLRRAQQDAFAEALAGMRAPGGEPHELAAAAVWKVVEA